MLAVFLVRVLRPNPHAQDSACSHRLDYAYIGRFMHTYTYPKTLIQVPVSFSLFLSHDMLLF